MACDIPVRDQNLCLTFPGGAQVCAQYPTAGGPSPLALAKQLMAQASAGLAPLGPIFDIIEFATAVKDFAEAVPGLITDPSAVVSAVGGLVEKVDALLQLIPQLSVPLLVLSLIDMLLAYLTGLVEVLNALAAQVEQIAIAEALANESGLDSLTDAVQCANQILTGQMSNLQAGAGPVDDLIALINTFVALVPGLPEIPTLGDLPDDPAAAVAPIEALVNQLTAIRGSIPV